MAKKALLAKRSPQEDTFPVMSDEIPRKILDFAYKEMCYYTIAFVYRDALCGSGTLISWGQEYGILTASHVTEQFDFNSSDELRLSIKRRGRELHARIALGSCAASGLIAGLLLAVPVGLGFLAAFLLGKKAPSQGSRPPQASD